MTEERKAELAQMCAVQIRQASAISKSRLADYGYHLVENVVDAEIGEMMNRLTDKSVRSGDIGLLRDLVIADLWPRLQKAHVQQRENVLGGISAGAEFACDIGWAGLVQDAVTRIETYPSAWKARAVGGKEKLGCLVLHIACDYDQPGCRSEIERLREEVRLRSLATCDICGCHGRLRISSMAKTVCDKHAAVLGEMRDDDGRWADAWKWHEESDVPVGIVGLAVSRQIETDIADRNREAEVLRRMASHIETAVAGAIIADEEDIRWVRSEVERWRNDFPLSEDEAAWLRTYVRSLAIDEMGRRLAADDPE